MKYIKLFENYIEDELNERLKYHFSLDDVRYTIFQAKTNDTKFGTKKDGDWDIYVKGDSFNPYVHDMEPKEFLKFLQRGIKYFNIRQDITHKDVADSEWKQFFKHELKHNEPLNKRIVIVKLHCGKANAKWHMKHSSPSKEEDSES
jgi:hypothetical protein